MDPEPGIPQARPPIGLTTGSVEVASGLSAKQRVARAYEEDLSGAKGPDARFDAIQELIDLRVREAINGIVFSSADGTQISGREGFFTAKSARERKVRVEPSSTTKVKNLWDLNVVSVESGTATVSIVRPGTILKEWEDLSVAITITDIDEEFSVSAGSLIYLKITGPADTPAVVLESGSDWTDHPAPVETTSSSATAEFTAYHYPLWEFLSTSDDERDLPLGENLFARKLVGSTHFLRTWLPYQKGSDKMFGSHFLLPYHRKISS